MKNKMTAEINCQNGQLQAPKAEMAFESMESMKKFFRGWANRNSLKANLLICLYVDGKEEPFDEYTIDLNPNRKNVQK